MSFFREAAELPTVDTALPGRAWAIPTSERSFINDRPLNGPYPDGLEVAYFAGDHHQQHLAKNPNGYCGIGGAGVTRPIGVGVEA